MLFQLRQSFFLFLTATIWGSGFVAQSVGMDHVTPFTYTIFRTFLGAVVLLPIVFLVHRRLKKQAQQIAAGEIPASKIHGREGPFNTPKDLFWGSICCGACLVAAESFQQFGLVTTDAGKAGFLTSMYIVIVPILGLFIGKKLNANIVVGVVLSLVGLYLLCIKAGGSFSLERGDTLILICAVVFSFHILTIDYFVRRCDGVYLSCGQFFAASLIAFILMVVVDGDVFSWDNVFAAGLAILWSGIMSNGVAYTLQVVGQRGMHPTIATLIMSLESVMAVVFGTLLLDERMTSREGIGCALLLAAVLIAQISPRMLLSLWQQRKQAQIIVQEQPETTTQRTDTTAKSAAPVEAVQPAVVTVEERR